MGCTLLGLIAQPLGQRFIEEATQGLSTLPANPVGQAAHFRFREGASFVERRRDITGQANPAGRVQGQGATGRSMSQTGCGLGISGVDTLGARQPVSRLLDRRGPQIQPAATRPYRRGQAPGRMGHQEQDTALWRFFQRLENGIGGIRVHVVGTVDDTDPPATLGAGAFLEEMRSFAGFLNGDFGPPALALVVPGRPQQQEIRIRLGLQQFADRVLGGTTQRAMILHRSGAEDSAGRPPGQTGLADPARPGDHPGVMEAATLPGSCKTGFGVFMAEQVIAFPRRQTAGLNIRTDVRILTHAGAPSRVSMAAIAFSATRSGASNASRT